MTNEIAMRLSGILFLFILATGIASRALGYELDDRRLVPRLVRAAASNGGPFASGRPMLTVL